MLRQMITWQNGMADDFTVRAAKPEDAEAVLRLTASVRKATYAALIPAGERANFASILAINPENIEKWRHKIVKSTEQPTENIAKVVIKNGKVVGFYGARIKNGLLHIQNLYIDQALQGQGLGGRLLNEGIAANSGLPVELYVLVNNETAVGFYKRHGFRVTGESNKKFYGASRYVMKRHS